MSVRKCKYTYAIVLDINEGDTFHLLSCSQGISYVTSCGTYTIEEGKEARNPGYNVSNGMTMMNKRNATNGRTPEEIAWDFRLLFQLVEYTISDIPEENYTRAHNILMENRLSVSALLKELSPSCDEMLMNCRWKGEPKQCEHLFERVETTDGFCCSFNYYALTTHTFNKVSASRMPAQPRRVSACGHQTALEVTVVTNPNDYFASHFPSFGHKILVHNPYHFPDWAAQQVLSEINTLLLVSVNPTLTYSSEDIKTLPISSRQCLFSEEKDLGTFNGYTFHNCMLQCRINLTAQLCGCRPFYSGTGNGQDTCSFKDLPCLAENEQLIYSSIPGYNFTSNKNRAEYDLDKSVCQCLPDCNYIEYISEMSSGILNLEFSSLHRQRANVHRNQSIVKIFFNDLVATRNRRDVIFTWHSLLAYYGGILGLFTGFSFVSGMELVYFFIIKLLADKTRDPDDIQKTKKINVQKINLNSNPLIYDKLNAKTLMAKSNYEFGHNLIPYTD